MKHVRVFYIGNRNINCETNASVSNLDCTYICTLTTNSYQKALQSHILTATIISNLKSLQHK